MSVEVTIFLKTSVCCPGHYATSSYSIVTDLNDKSKIFYITFPHVENNQKRLENYLLKLKLNNTRTEKYTHVTIISDKSYDAFVAEYAKQFSNEKNYSCCSNNCSHATQRALDHFFPETIDEKNNCSPKRLCCIVASISTLGCCRCCSPTPLISTPTAVFERAEHIYESQQGKKLTATTSVNSVESDGDVKMADAKTHSANDSNNAAHVSVNRETVTRFSFENSRFFRTHAHQNASAAATPAASASTESAPNPMSDVKAAGVLSRKRKAQSFPTPANATAFELANAHTDPGFANTAAMNYKRRRA